MSLLPQTSETDTKKGIELFGIGEKGGQHAAGTKEHRAEADAIPGIEMREAIIADRNIGAEMAAFVAGRQRKSVIIAAIIRFRIGCGGQGELIRHIQVEPPDEMIVEIQLQGRGQADAVTGLAVAGSRGEILGIRFKILFVVIQLAKIVDIDFLAAGDRCAIRTAPRGIFIIADGADIQ